jgi:hypothetical protein
VTTELYLAVGSEKAYLKAYAFPVGDKGGLGLS